VGYLIANDLSWEPHRPARCRQHRKHQYHRVAAKRKSPIRGLRVRSGRYYAQLTIEDPEAEHKKVRRVSLGHANTPKARWCENEKHTRNPANPRKFGDEAAIRTARQAPFTITTFR
jgi:hypothetical protein